MFKITLGKGFHITFENGWTASVQWGCGNNCENKLRGNGSLKSEREAGARGSATAEIAAWFRYSDGSEMDHLFTDGACTNKGYCTPEEVLAFLNEIAEK